MKSLMVYPFFFLNLIVQIYTLPNPALLNLNLNLGGAPAAPSKDDACSGEIKTANGPIKGKLVKSGTGEDVCAFFGIPFAKPPIGELRFARPEPVADWTAVKEVREQPHACVQEKRHVYGSGKTELIEKVSEDCLYLNIWVPFPIYKSKENATAPLMIWIHGGGFYVGFIKSRRFDGAILAGQKNVIVASIQYRLGPLGFLYFGVRDAPGNVGLLDQMFAIKWLSENIVHFGGNKDEITLFGESAGGFAVGYHMLSAKTRPLFKRGIPMSGIATSDLLYRTPENAIEFSDEFASFMKCNTSKEVADKIKCLKKADAQLISGFRPKKKFSDIPVGVTVDGYFLDDTPENLLKKLGEKPTKMEVMIGVVANEATGLFLKSFPEFFQPNKIANLKFEDFSKIMNEMFRSFPDAKREKIIAHYTNDANKEDSDVNRQNILNAHTDWMFLCPAKKFAQIWAEQGSNVYFYYFDQKSHDRSRAPWASTIHGDDIEYTFGTPLADPKRSKENHALAKQFQTLLADFATTGVPSKNWETYTKDHPVYLSINSTIISGTSTPGLFGPRDEHCKFWNEEVPAMS